MECNKDEAFRAKDIALRKFTERDFSGSKKFALKAQNLFPELEGISQMLTTLDVHISAARKVGGEMDLYGILGVNPLADDETIKRQYRKLVLLLHPDKNKSIGADGAFQFVSDAFSLLSDKAKRSAYDTRRHIKMANRIPSQSGAPVPKPSTGRAAFQKVSIPSGSVGNGSSRGTSQKSGIHKASPQAQSTFVKGDTFWTSCSKCKMQYEYMRVYLNQRLKCPNCDQGFVAVETAPPTNITPLRPEEVLPKSGPNVSFGGSNAHWGPFSGTNVYCYESQVKKGGLKRDNDTSFGFRGEDPSKRMKEMGDSHVRNYGSGISGQRRTKNMDASMGKANGFTGYSVRVNVNRELSAVEIKNMLTQKALAELRMEVGKAKLASEEKAAAKEKAKVKQKERQKSKLAKSMESPVSFDNSSELKKTSVATSAGDIVQETSEYIVPDPDFHIFDYDRSERCFKENQVWAAYDNDDGMPRIYALIHNVISLKPFKVKISWLNSRSNSEFGTFDWVGRGFTKSSGDFWVGRRETNQLLNSFSHKVRYNKGPRGVIQIYPRGGDIWALYRNWSRDWRQNTSDEIIHAYDMVEVIQDYDEEEGAYVAPIVKANGFRTVFCKQPDPKDVQHIPKEEMFRFSHQVPHHILTGYEKPNAPKGLLELDPASTPVELLQVTGSPVNVETKS